MCLQICSYKYLTRWIEDLVEMDTLACMGGPGHPKVDLSCIWFLPKLFDLGGHRHPNVVLSSACSSSLMMDLLIIKSLDVGAIKDLM